MSRNLMCAANSFSVGEAFPSAPVTTELSAEAVEAAVERFVSLGDDRHIQRVFVQGRCVKPRREHDLV